MLQKRCAFLDKIVSITVRPAFNTGNASLLIRKMNYAMHLTCLIKHLYLYVNIFVMTSAFVRQTFLKLFVLPRPNILQVSTSASTPSETLPWRRIFNLPLSSLFFSNSKEIASQRWRCFIRCRAAFSFCWPCLSQIQWLRYRWTGSWGFWVPQFFYVLTTNLNSTECVSAFQVSRVLEIGVLAIQGSLSTLSSTGKRYVL